jgi:type I restriction enzyme M protein
LFRGASEGKIRRKLIEENLLEAVIGLPANLFFGTGIPAAILIFNRGKANNTDVLFVDASQCYESAKNQNKLRLVEDINPIVESYEQFNQGQLQPGVIKGKYSYVATFDEIAENDFNLNIPRYVDTFEKEAEVDITAVQTEIEGLEGELKTVQAEIEKHLTQLVD